MIDLLKLFVKSLMPLKYGRLCIISFSKSPVTFVSLQKGREVETLLKDMGIAKIVYVNK